MPDIPQENEIVFFAETNFRGQRKRFGVKRQDRRKHVYIIGKTGMGKSTVLENMTIQDILAGRGVAVVDPHGEYAEKMLDFIPPERINDVIYFNPADTDFPLAFNIMENVGEDQRHLVSSGLLGVFKKIFGPDVWSARMEYLLANAILALMEIPGATLLSVNRMFGEKDFRKRIVSSLTDPVIKGFWENEFAKYPEQYMREAVAAIQNKIGQFSGNPLIRNVIGQPTTSFDIRRVMDEQKILIINLAKGRVGEENSRLLGAMMVTKLYLTAMSRVDIPEPARNDFYLYVDEFQNFATESFANILSEARKYRLNLTVAHQYVFQMEEMVQHAIFGNVGTMVVFRVGGEDAELLEKEFLPEFTQQDLVNLGFKQIYTKLMIDGITSRPFSAETLPPFPPPAETSRDAIIQASREHFGTPRALVEEKIRSFTAGATVTPEGPAMGSGGEPPLRSSQAAPRAATGAGERALGGVAADRPAEGPLRSEASEARQERPMYEAHCAVDGKPILLPFKPDGVRPVYCEEHMAMIKFRSKGGGSEAKGGGEAPASLSRREGATPAAAHLRHASLRDLRRDKPVTAGPMPPGAGKMRSGADLAALRKLLQESLTSGNAPAAEPAPGRRDEPTRNGSQPLAPGETIRFE